MAEKEELVLSPETIAMLKKPVDPGCPLCKWILEDFALHGKLTGYPENFDHSGQFPASGKEKHIRILKKIEEGRREKPKRKAKA
jgi:hypothetical protein